MTRTILDDVQCDELVKLYKSGVKPKELMERFGISNSVLYRTLKRCGCETCQYRIQMPEGVVEAYESGESVYSIAKRLGVSRNVVDRWLYWAGVQKRGCSEAGRVRAAKMTPEERAAQAAAAHEAAKGRVCTEEERAMRARTVQLYAAIGRKKMSSSEATLYELLVERGITPTREKAIGRYNVDFAVNGTAIEVHGGGWHAVRQRRMREATRYNHILDAGWSVIIIWDTSYVRIDASGADKVVSLLEGVGSDPTSVGEYWVIRGDGKLMSSGCGQMDETSLILSLESSE